jgi:hypothetical protein
MYMRSLRYSLITVVFFFSSLLSVSACGTERWAVKTLTDDSVGDINHTPESASVTELGQKDAPSQQSLHQDGDSRFGPVETTTYRVKALLLGYRSEEDEDFHLVLADPDTPDNTMIAEIPASGCVNDEAFGEKLQNMRDALVSRFGEPGPHTKRLPHPVPITLRGIGFFDIKHSTPQDGVAPNGIELHPVLGMRLPAN